VSELRLRVANRALVLDERNRVLLVRFSAPDREIWLTTGGGVEEGETDEEAVRRELLEEAGLTGFELGPVVWTRTVLQSLEGGRWDGQTERFYLVRTRSFEPVPALSWQELRVEGMTAVRWWTLDELEAAETLFAPRRLPSLLRDLIERGPPSEPLDVGL
jgi:8-oxo-dGTP pyrophosphatase MutT (NUDIX family)